jgi:hypothetical protein
MRKIGLNILLPFVILFFSAMQLHAQTDEKNQRIQTSYLLAFGQLPSSGEVNHWSKQSQSNNLKELMDQHKAYIRGGGYRTEAIKNSYKDAFGRNPSDAEVKWWAQYNQNYTELMKAHLKFARDNSSAYDDVIKRAFKYVRGTEPDAEELAAWKRKGVKSYVMLVGMLQYAKSKSGTKKLLFWEDLIGAASYAISYVKINFNILKEAQSLIGPDGGSLIGNDAGSIVAAGAGNIRPDASIVGNAGGNIVAAGAGNIVAAGGLN